MEKWGWGNRMSSQGFEPKKLLSLIRNPGNSRNLTPHDDWLYGVIGAAIGVAGFTLWAWAEQSGIRRTLSLFADLVFSAVISGSSIGKLLWVGILSIIVLSALLTIAGNRIGERKRSWMEAAAYYGGAQVWFGVAMGLNALIALVLWKVSLMLMLALLLLNLNWLLTQASELHEVGSGRKLLFLGIVIGIYAALLAVATAWTF